MVEELHHVRGSIFVAEDSRILHADEALMELVGFSRPAWAGAHLHQVLPIEPVEADDGGDPQPAQSRLDIARFEGRELFSRLPSGRRILMTVREVPPDRAWFDAHPRYRIAPELWAGTSRIFLLSCVSADLPDRLFRSAAQTELRSTIGSIIAGFAHEVRNPLAAIVALVDGLLVPDTPDDVSEVLTRIPGLVERIERLLKIALSYGRPRKPRASWHQLGHAMARAVEMLEQAGFDVPSSMRRVAETNTPIFVDMEHFLSTLINVVQNAVEEAGADRVSVRVASSQGTDWEAVYARGPQVYVDVTDLGGGIPSNVRERIFQPFFTTKSSGTGLGLALARDLARMNGGDLVLLNTSRAGTTFRISAPTRATEPG